MLNELMAHFGCIFCHTRYFFAVQRGAWPKWPNGKYATAYTATGNTVLSCLLACLAGPVAAKIAKRSEQQIIVQFLRAARCYKVPHGTRPD